MSLTVFTYPNVKDALKTWLPTVPEISALVDDHVFFSIPDNTTGLWPMITITGPVAGGPDAGPTPTNTPWIQFDCWAEPAPTGRRPREKQATDIALTLCGVLNGLDGGIQIEDTKILWADVISMLPFSDPNSLQARYIVTAEISAVSTA